MTTWIFGIDEGNPQHWDYAKRYGIWHLTKRVGVKAGDHIYFWQTGDPKTAGYKPGLIGLVRARTDLEPVRPGETMPWNIGDDKRDNYKFRVELDVVSPESTSVASWTTLKTNTGVAGALNFGPREVKSTDGERWLRRQLDIGETEDISLTLQDAVDVIDPGDADSDEDLRRRVRASIVVREGQGTFRQGLLDAYREQCAITGISEPVLDAAHIRPYKGRHSHAPSNGLLLRTDLHTLFDKHLLTVVHDAGYYRVRVSDDLSADMYRELDQQLLQVVPLSAKHRPSPGLLEEHNNECRKKWAI